MPPKPNVSKLAERQPWLPTEAEPADTTALQALQRGEADPEQQKRALDWIITKASGMYEFSYFTGHDGQRNTDFALGRAYVGQQIVRELKIALSKLRGKP